MGQFFETLCILYVAVTHTQCCSVSCSSSLTVKHFALIVVETMRHNCVDSTKDGYKIYFKWKRTWSSNAKAEANVKLFLVDQYLPFWVQCTSCGRWRQLPKETSLSPDLIRSYKCDASIEVTVLLMSFFCECIFVL